METTWLVPLPLAVLVLSSDTPDEPGVRGRKNKSFCVCLGTKVTATRSPEKTPAHRHLLLLTAEEPGRHKVFSDPLDRREFALAATGPLALCLEFHERPNRRGTTGSGDREGEGD